MSVLGGASKLRVASQHSLQLSRLWDRRLSELSLLVPPIRPGPLREDLSEAEWTEYFGGVPLDDGSLVHTLCPLMPVNVICGWQLLDQP